MNKQSSPAGQYYHVEKTLIHFKQVPTSQQDTGHGFFLATNGA